MTLSDPILITGASGFVGAHLCLHFLRKGQSVIAVERSLDTPGAWRLEHVKDVAQSEGLSHLFKSHPLDLTSRPDVRSAVLGFRPTVIMNCAAYGAYSNQTDADAIYQVNFEAVRTLLELAREIPRFRAFIQAGSSSEYGFNCTAPNEDAPTSPDSHYAVSKVAATQLARFYAMKYDLPAWTVRLYSVYGALEDASRLISKALLCSLEQKLPPLAHPRISRDFVFVEDVCQAFEALIARSAKITKGGIYNIGSGQRTRLEDLVSLLRSRFNLTETPAWGSMADRAWDHPDWYADPSKAARDLEWRALTPLAEGLAATRSWFQSHPDLVQKALQNTVLAPAPV